jgi:hypothetical protein
MHNGIMASAKKACQQIHGKAIIVNEIKQRLTTTGFSNN